MNRHSRSCRFFWLLGVILAAGSAIGASWVYYSHAGESVALQDPNASASAGASSAPVACAIGYVDSRNGMRSLYPVQPGRVVDVLVEENQKVPAGAVLLTLDKERATFLVRQAEADLQAAATQLELARKGVEQQALKEAQQQAAIDAAQGKVKEAECGLERKQKLLGVQVSKEEVAEAKALVEQAQAGVRAMEKRLEELKLNDPTLTIRAAEAALAAKQAQLDEARKGLSECELKAPVAGTIVRLWVGKGEVLGPQPRQPAITFCPDEPRIVRAELDQEYADRVKEGQPVEIEDDVKSGETWQGTVQSIAHAYMPRRQVGQEAIQVNVTETRVLECIITFNGGKAPPRFCQRVRVKIKHGSEPAVGKDSAS